MAPGLRHQVLAQMAAAARIEQTAHWPFTSRREMASAAAAWAQPALRLPRPHLVLEPHLNGEGLGVIRPSSPTAVVRRNVRSPEPRPQTRSWRLCVILQDLPSRLHQPGHQLIAASMVGIDGAMTLKAAQAWVSRARRCQPRQPGRVRPRSSCRAKPAGPRPYQAARAVARPVHLREAFMR